MRSTTTPLTAALAALFTLTLVANSAYAQDAPVEADVGGPVEAEGAAEAVEAVPVPELPAPEPEGLTPEQAQANVSKAKKLIKLQKFDEAAAMLEEAYLVLEDPELLRMLGELELARGDDVKASRFFASYLDDNGVGESSKASVRDKKKEADARLKAKTGAKPDKSGGEGGSIRDVTDEYGVTGWKSHGVEDHAAGQLYLSAGGRLVHNQGSEFEAVKSVENETVARGDWVHGGLGLNAAFGAYVGDNLSLNTTLGLDFMNWEHRDTTTDFKTRIYSGVRPELSVDLRYVLGMGFGLGALVGGDMMILTEGASSDTTCDGVAVCPDRSVESGLQGYRGFVGAVLGYRTELTEDLALGFDAAYKYIPLFIGLSDAAENTPGFLDTSWMGTFGVLIHYNL